MSRRRILQVQSLGGIVPDVAHLVASGTMIADVERGEGSPAGQATSAIEAEMT